jgi:hypothetical protein
LSVFRMEARIKFVIAFSLESKRDCNRTQHSQKQHNPTAHTHELPVSYGVDALRVCVLPVMVTSPATSWTLATLLAVSFCMFESGNGRGVTWGATLLGGEEASTGKGGGGRARACVVGGAHKTKESFAAICKCKDIVPVAVTTHARVDQLSARVITLKESWVGHMYGFCAKSGEQG